MAQREFRSLVNRWRTLAVNAWCISSRNLTARSKRHLVLGQVADLDPLAPSALLQVDHRRAGQGGDGFDAAHVAKTRRGVAASAGRCSRQASPIRRPVVRCRRAVATSSTQRRASSS